MKKSVSAQVMEELLTDIFCNQFRPGQILSERMLTEAYGCSKTTMREVLATLCHTRILRSIPRMGYEVIWVEENQAREVLDVRRAIELGLFQKNISRITPEILQQLQNSVDLERKARIERDMQGQWDQNARFHMILIRLANNGYAEWSLQFALDTLKRSLVQNVTGEPDWVYAGDTLSYHEQILDALAQGDFDGACRALEKDLHYFDRFRQE